MKTPPAAKLPDPWLFDSEALLRELDRCRETVLQIPVTNPNATHFGIQLAVNAIYNLTENLRYLLHLHREQQRSIRRQHEQTLEHVLATGTPVTDNVVTLHSHAPAQNNAARHHPCRTTATKRRGSRSSYARDVSSTTQVA
jgi:hypothetical protein